MVCTIFKNFGDKNNPHQIEIKKTLDRIKNGNSKDKVLEIRRKVAAGEPYDSDKKDLPFIEYSAAKTKMMMSRDDEETHRLDACVVEHSGFFGLDWDDCDVQSKIEQLKRDPYIYAIWLGPSGKSVKSLVKCPPSVESHSLYYTAFLDRYPELDSTSRNIARGQYESYDPNLWMNQNSLVWDKKLSEEQRRKNKENNANRRGKSVLSTAVAMVRSSYDGNKHETLLKAANLVGGYISAGRVNEEEAVKILEEEIRAKNPKDFQGAANTIRDGIAYGKTRPLAESKKIEKAQQYLRREDGSYDFLASMEEMDEYLISVINGTLEFGLPTGFNGLNSHWMFKKHHLVWMAALDGIGKSHFVWYLGVIVSKFHGWKVIINAGENGDGQVRKKLMEFYLGKSVKLADDEELTMARDFINDNFRIISSKNLHSMEEFLLKCEILIDEGFEADVVIGEPFNSFDVAVEANMYMITLRSLNLMRVFKERYCSLWITDHIGTAAARKKDKNGFVEPPWKADVDQGQMKCNKADDFILLHRLVNHPYDHNKLQVHVAKVRDIETGGFPTKKDEPVILEINKDYAGYSWNGQDPIKHFKK